MTEKKKPIEGFFGYDEKGGSGFAPLDDKETASSINPVTITCGPYLEKLPVHGMTVNEIKNKYSDRFDIPEDANAHINGHEVDNNTKVEEGQTLMFIRHAGAKGK